MLPHAARLAGSPYARSFTRGLALSLLQRKPDEWRRQYATPSSRSSANTATSSLHKDNSRSKTTAPSAVAVALTDDEHHDVDSEGDEAGMLSPERGRVLKKRKRSTAAVDETDALFDDAIGRKVVRSALESVPAPEPDFVKSVSKIADSTLKQGRGQGDQSVNRHADLGAVVDVIEVAPHREGKKRSKQRLNSA